MSGQWLSEDPMLSERRCAYVGGRPVSMVDSDGRMSRAATIMAKTSFCLGVFVGGSAAVLTAGTLAITYSMAIRDGGLVVHHLQYIAGDIESLSDATQRCIKQAHKSDGSWVRQVKDTVRRTLADVRGYFEYPPDP